MRLFRSTTLDSNANTYVGDSLSLFVGNDYVLRISDNTKPGGVTIQGGSGAIIQSPTPPTDANDSTLWYDEVSGRLYVYYENVWVDAAPAAGITGPTGAPSTVTGPTGSIGLTGPTGPDVTGPTGPGGTGSFVRSDIIASSGQTVFTATYTPGYLDVYYAGVLLPVSSYTATNGSTVVLNNPAIAGDRVSIIAWNFTGATPNTGDIIFGANADPNNISSSDSNISISINSPGEFGAVDIWSGDYNGPIGGEVYLEQTGVYVTTNNESKQWQFDNYGNINLAYDGGIQFTNGTINTVGGGINVRAYNGSFTVSVDESSPPTTPYVAWTFDRYGNLTLPEGGTVNWYDGSNALVGGGSGAIIQYPSPPADPTTSTLWYDEVSGRLYVYYEGVWVDAAPAAAGPTGPQGPTGAASTVTGPIGSTGPTGTQGPTGADSTVTGPIGSTGPTGTQGPTGADSTVTGPTGPTGSSANLGNLSINDQTISGINAGQSIVLSPNGNGSITMIGNTNVVANSTLTTYPLDTPNLTFRLQAADQTAAVLAIDSFGDSLSGGVLGGAGVVDLRRFGGNSAAPTAVLNNQYMGSYVANGYDGAGFIPEAATGMLIKAGENFNPGAHGSRIELWSVPDGSITSTINATFSQGGSTIGNINLTGNTISLTNSAVNLNLGVPGQVGSVVVNSTLKVVDGQGNVVLTNSTAGQIYVVSGYQNPDKSSVLNVIGNWAGASNVPANPGGMLQITGHDGVTSRVLNDSYGSSVFSVFVGRKANGTAAAPTTTTAGSVARFSGAVYTPTLGFNPSSVSPGYMDIQLLATATDTSLPTRIAFYTAPSGSLIAQNVANVDTGGITLPYAGSGITFPDGSKQTTAGGISNVVAVTNSTYSMGVLNRFVGVNYAGGAVTVTLAQGTSLIVGTTVTVKDTGGNAALNPITVQAYAGDAIDGGTTATINANYNSYTLILSAANTWSIV